MARRQVRSMSHVQKATMKKEKCELLLKTMDGTQDASHVWQLDYTALLLDEKFEQGKAWTSDFVHKEQDIKRLVHGDDFFPSRPGGARLHAESSCEEV